MKLTSAAILCLTLPALAQTAFAQTRPLHHTSTSSTGACSTESGSKLSAKIPKEAGCEKQMYALRYVDFVVGTGAPVVPRRWLTVAYTGYLADGTKFDTSVGKDPITFPYGARQVIPGWDTGFEGMRIGGHRRLYVPYQLAYGETGRPPVIPAKSELIFDMELLAISENPPAPKTPPTPPTPPVNGAKPPAGGATVPPPPTGGATPPPASGTTSPNNNGAPPVTPPAPSSDPTKPTATPPKQ